MAGAETTPGELKLFLWINGLLAVASAVLATFEFSDGESSGTAWTHLVLAVLWGLMAIFWWLRLRRHREHG